MGVEHTPFQTAATEDDKDYRLDRNGHHGLYFIKFKFFLRKEFHLKKFFFNFWNLHFVHMHFAVYCNQYYLFTE